MLKIDQVKSDYQKIHSFGLGFVQLKVSKFLRYHFYHPELVVTGAEDVIHNHQYNFLSTILTGRLVEWRYRFVPTLREHGSHRLIQKDCKTGEGFDREEFGNVVQLSQIAYKTGQTYSIESHEFHRVEAHDTITKLIRYNIKPGLSTIITPQTYNPVCPFGVDVGEARCWELVEDMLRRHYGQ